MKNAALFVAILFSATTVYSQQEIAGIWNTGENNTKIEITEDAGLFVGKIISSDDSSIKIGNQILKDVKFNNGEGKGKVYAAKKGKWYDAVLQRKDNYIEVKLKVGLIEDEKLTAKDLESSVKEIRPEYNLIKTLPSVKSAIAFLKTKPLVDLILSDIQLTDGLSFEVFKKVQVEAPVIFCTAYDEYALNAFKVNGIAYILKPFTTEAIELSIEKFETLTQIKDNKLTALLKFMEQSIQTKPNPSMLVHQGEKIIPVNLDDVAIVSLKNGVVRLHTFDKMIYVVSESLEELEKLNIPDFFRANRQYLIHHKAIKNATRYFNRRLSLHLHFSFEEKIIISREKAPSFLEWLANH